MDAKGPFDGHERTLPVLSRPPVESWPTGATPHSDYYALHNSTIAPANISFDAAVPPTTYSAAVPPAEASTPAPPKASASKKAQAPAASTSADHNAGTKVRKQRKPANASTGKSTLFWVNTDPESASGGTKEETLKRIRSHVMSEHNRKKRLENTKRYKSKTWKHLPFQPPEQIAGAMGPPRPPPTVPLTSPSSRPRSGSASGSASSHRGSYVETPVIKSELVPVSNTVIYQTQAIAETETWDEHNLEDFDGVVGYQPQATAPPVWTYVGPGAHDPFNTGHTQLTDRMMRHLQNFLSELTQEAHPLQMRYKPKLQAHWSTLIQRDPAILHATICMSTSNAAMQRGELPIRDPSQHRSALVVDTIYHRGETIRLVNEGLSDPVKASSDELIAAVSTLLIIEIASGNPDYLKIHLAGLRQMIGLRKNFADVPSDVRFQISWTDIRVACMALTKPIFPFVRSIRPAGFELFPPNDDVALLATRLYPLMKIPGIFSDRFSQILKDLVELCWYAEWIKGTTAYREFNDETEDYFNFEVLSVEYALHTDRYTPTGQAKGDNSIEGCTRLACLCFHNSAIWSFYPMMAPLLPKPILALRTALEATIPNQLFALCHELLFWLLFIGAACSQVMPAERSYFVSQLAAAARLHRISTWQEARVILLGFFYTDRVHLPMLRQIWSEVQLQWDLSPV